MFPTACPVGMMAIWYCLIVVVFCVGMEYMGGRKIVFGKCSAEKVGEIWEQEQVIRSCRNGSEGEGEFQVKLSTLLR